MEASPHSNHRHIIVVVVIIIGLDIVLIMFIIEPFSVLSLDFILVSVLNYQKNLLWV